MCTAVKKAHSILSSIVKGVKKNVPVNMMLHLLSQIDWVATLGCCVQLWPAHLGKDTIMMEKVAEGGENQEGTGATSQCDDTTGS